MFEELYKAFKLNNVEVSKRGTILTVKWSDKLSVHLNFINFDPNIERYQVSYEFLISNKGEEQISDFHAKLSELWSYAYSRLK